MSRAIVLIVLLAAAGVMPAIAAPAPIFGMQLHSPFTMHECAFEKIGKSLSYKLAQPTCYRRSSAGDIGKPLTTDTVEIKWQQFPSIVSPAGYTLATVIDGNLEGLSFNTLGVVSQDRDLALLVEKFGQPTTIIRPHLQNGYGAQYVGVLASWDLDAIVSFESATSLNSGTVRIDTPKGAAARNAADSRKGSSL